MSSEGDEKKGYEPLIVPPDGYPKWDWSQDLDVEAYNQEVRRLVDDVQPGHFRESLRARERSRRDNEIKKG